MNATSRVVLLSLSLPVAVAVGGCVAVERPAPARETVVVPAQPAPAEKVIVTPDVR